MSEQKEKFTDLAAGYVLGILDESEEKEFLVLLNNAGAESLELYRRMQYVTTLLAGSVEQTEPGWKAKEHLIEQVYNSSKEPIKIGFFEQMAITLGFDRPTFAMGLTLFLAILVLSFGIYSTRLRHTIKHQGNQLTELKSNIEKNKQLLSVIQAPRVDMVMLNGMDNMPDAYGKIIWNPSDKTAILQISNLPEPPAGKAYQLWIMQGKKPMSAGVFAITQTDTNAFFKITHMAETNRQIITAFKITMEPKGGMSHPTGEICLMGKTSDNS